MKLCDDQNAIGSSEESQCDHLLHFVVLVARSEKILWREATHKRYYDDYGWIPLEKDLVLNPLCGTEHIPLQYN